jgi:thiol:disulfide interchange protein
VLSAVEFKKVNGPPTTLTYYLGSDFVPRQAQIVSKSSGKEETTVVMATSLAVSGKVDSTRFAFKAPEGSRELTAEEMSADKWYTNFDEALAAAKATNRLVLVDFYTGWCHWCKVLRAEVFPKAEFKAMSKYFVFCEIDAEAETGLASRYGVKAYPTSVFVDGDGNEVHRLEGYKPVDGYVAEMETARQKGGK